MNEMWASEVERRLRMISDRMAGLNQAALRNDGQAGFGFPVTNPGVDEGEIIWIRLTSKIVIDGVNTYEWRQQTCIMTAAGIVWTDSGNFGTIAENPAIGLNNEDRSTIDGKRYPAKYNADTGQWIFFLRESETPASIFVDTLKIRQLWGEYWGTDLRTRIRYDDPDIPERLRLRRYPLPFTSFLLDNYDVTPFMMEWTTATKVNEYTDTDTGSEVHVAEYRAVDDADREIAYLYVQYHPDTMSCYARLRKITRQIEGGVINYAFRVGAAANGPVVYIPNAVLLAGTSGLMNAFQNSGGGLSPQWQAIYLEDAAGGAAGGNAMLQFCWGDECVTPGTPGESADFSDGPSATSLKLADGGTNITVIQDS